MILSGYQLMVKCIANRRPSLNNIWKEVFPTGEPAAKSMIQISGYPGSGKRIMLCELMARASLPHVYGGKYSQVIFLDLAHKFDLKTFTEYIKRYIKQQSNESTTTECLEAIIHLPCYSLDQFELAFKEIEDLLWDNKRVALLAVDGLETFYWEHCHNQLQRMTTHYKKLIQRFKKICETHNICCAFTIETNFLCKMNTLFTAVSAIDYRIKMSKMKDGRSFLNDIPIEIKDNCIEFLTKNIS